MPRARELGMDCWSLPPGELNALTDVPGVRVGHVSIREEALTGVTAILPPGDPYREPFPASAFVVNGYGKAVGLAQLIETGRIESPVVLTSTLCVWRAAEAVYEFVSRGPWPAVASPSPEMQKPVSIAGPSVRASTSATARGGGREVRTLNPVVLECNDSWLNGGPCRAVEMRHVTQALESARGGAVEEGDVGAGTGMTAFGFKSGIGTASRRVGEHLLGALVLSNAGRRAEMRLGGVWVGRELEGAPTREEGGSAVAAIATDAPAGAHELRRLAKRVTHGFARVGLTSSAGSGEFAVIFSVSRARRGVGPRVLSGLFAGVVEAVEEAYANSLLYARAARGKGGFVPAVPAGELAKIFEKSP